jgi:fructan beta-fructosidase
VAALQVETWEEKMATEQFRPEYHFTPAQNWQNDPNGLFY